MKKHFILLALAGLISAGLSAANGQLLIGGALNNGDLDTTYQQEIVPGFFLPKPAVWQNVGFRAITGPYEDELSSEPWAGPAPTPVTASDWGVFFKPFSGGGANGPATGHLFQDHPTSPGLKYTFSGWAGAEPNALAQKWVFALDFFDAGNNLLSGAELDLGLAGIFTPNGQPFNYKHFSFDGTAPAGAATVRARVSMIDAISNPAGGGQAFVVDDLQLMIIPEPSVLALSALGLLGFLAARRRD